MPAGSTASSRSLAKIRCRRSADASRTVHAASDAGEAERPVDRRARPKPARGSRAELVVDRQGGRRAHQYHGRRHRRSSRSIAAADVNLNGRVYGDDGAALIALSASTGGGGRKAAGIVERDGASGRPSGPARRWTDRCGEAGSCRQRARLRPRRRRGHFGRPRSSGWRPPTPSRCGAAAETNGAVTLRTRRRRSRTATSRSKISPGSSPVAGVRGRLALGLAEPLRVDGRLEADALDLAAILAAAAGMPARRPAASRPAGRTSRSPPDCSPMLPGRSSSTAQRATLVGDACRAGAARPHPARRRRVESSRIVAGRSRRRAPPRAARAARRSRRACAARTARAQRCRCRARCSRPGRGPPIAGRLALQVEAEGSGLSPAALVGSLRGAGTVTLEGTQIAGLDPKAFDTVIRAVDRGVTVDAAKVRDMMEAALQRRPHCRSARRRRLQPERRPGSLGQRGRRAGTGARPHRQRHRRPVRMDAGRATDACPERPPRRPIGDLPDVPDVFIALKGPIARRSARSMSSAFTGWLTLRAVERQSKRLEALESERQEAAVEPSTPATATIPPPRTGRRRRRAPGKPDEASDARSATPADGSQRRARRAEAPPAPQRDAAPPRAPRSTPPGRRAHARRRATISARASRRAQRQADRGRRSRRAPAERGDSRAPMTRRRPTSAGCRARRLLDQLFGSQR